MTRKQFWTVLSVNAAISLALLGGGLRLLRPAATVVPAVPSVLDTAALGIAPQKVKLQLSDGRQATFRFAVSAGTLTSSAAVGLDQTVNYDLLPVDDPPLPDPTPRPVPTPPAPTPPVPVIPTPPVPPPLPPLASSTLTLITAEGNWCAACLSLHNDTLPVIEKTYAGRLKELDYASAEAKTLYPESAFVPRWILKRPDGTTEKKIGYLTAAQVDQWMGAK